MATTTGQSTSSFLAQAAGREGGQSWQSIQIQLKHNSYTNTKYETNEKTVEIQHKYSTNIIQGKYNTNPIQRKKGRKLGMGRRVKVSRVGPLGPPTNVLAPPSKALFTYLVPPTSYPAAIIQLDSDVKTVSKVEQNSSRISAQAVPR